MPPFDFTVSWPLSSMEPRLRLTIPKPIPKSWVKQVAPQLLAAPRFALAPVGAPDHPQLVLEASGDSFKPVQQPAIEWPLSLAAGAELQLCQRLMTRVVEVKTGVKIRKADVAVGDAAGNVEIGTHARAGEPVRIWTRDELTTLPPDATQLSPHTFGIIGKLEQVIHFSTPRRRFSLGFQSVPLALDASGKRWEPDGPHIGVPRIAAAGISELEVCLPGGRWVSLTRHAGMFDLPLEDVAQRHRLRFRAGNKTDWVNLKILPSDTQHKLELPASDGSRCLLVSSSQLASVVVRRLDDNVVVATADAGQHDELCVKLPPIERRQQYVAELIYPGCPVPIPAPVLDVRRHFDLVLGATVLALGPEHHRGPTVHRALARLGTVSGIGVERESHVAVLVCSAGRRGRSDQRRMFDGWIADRSGNVTIPLCDVVDDLELDTTHEVSVRAGALARFCFTIKDSYFVREPQNDEPYAELLPYCTLGRAPEWRWIPATEPWRCWRGAPMVETPGGWVPPPLDIPAGGILAAPFDGDRRVGHVRLIPDSAGAAILDPLGGDLDVKAGPSLATLRAEFDGDKARRERLAELIENVAVFDADDALDVPRLAKHDGALVAWLAMRPVQAQTTATEPHVLRAIPIGAWWRAVAAALDDYGQLPALDVPEEWLLLAVLISAGLPVASEHRGLAATLVERLASCRPVRRATRTEAGTSPVALTDLAERLPLLLEDWRRGDKVTLHDLTISPSLHHRLQGRAIHDSVHRDVLALINAQACDTERFFLTPLALGALAARVVLDPGLSREARGELRTQLLEQRQLRVWQRCEPLVGALYLYSLCRLWSDLHATCPTAEALRKLILEMEVA